MSDAATISLLNGIALNVNKIIPPIALIAGTFGHICNILIFSKRSQRTNSTSMFFLSGTFANLIVLYAGLFIRYLQDVYGIDPVNNNLIVCKFRSFFLNCAFGLSNWFVLFATIDRYLISSNDIRRRQLSNLTNAYRSIGILILIFALLYCHIFILYNIQNLLNSNNQWQNYCYPQRGPYRIFSDVQTLIQFSLLPPILMGICGILTVRNIHAARRRVANTIVTSHVRIKQRDLQLSKMLLLQVILTVVFSLPLALTQLSITMTLNWTKTPLRLTIENVVQQMTRLLAFSNCAISFYLYTLAGSQFRLEFKHVINRCSMLFCRRRILLTTRIGIEQAPVGKEPKLAMETVPKRNITTSERQE